MLSASEPTWPRARVPTTSWTSARFSSRFTSWSSSCRSSILDTVTRSNKKEPVASCGHVFPTGRVAPDATETTVLGTRWCLQVARQGILDEPYLQRHMGQGNGRFRNTDPQLFTRDSRAGLGPTSVVSPRKSVWTSSFEFFHWYRKKKHRTPRVCVPERSIPSTGADFSNSASWTSITMDDILTPPIRGRREIVVVVVCVSRNGLRLRAFGFCNCEDRIRNIKPCSTRNLYLS